MTYPELSTILKAVSNFFAHPFVVAITVFFFSQKVIKAIIPDAKQKLINKILDIKNYLKEVEYLYNRIVMTRQNLQKKINANENVEGLKKVFEAGLPKETSRISNLVNETIPIASHKLDSDIEIFFDDKELSNAHKEYNQAFYQIQNFIVNEFPNQNDFLSKKLSELQGFSFDPIHLAEKKLLRAISNAKSLKLKNR